MTILLFISLISCGVVIYSAVAVGCGVRKMKALGDVNDIDHNGGPLVSIVMPACNEEENLESAILSLLDQNYENIEIVVVNDRSTDDTGAILEKLKRQYPALKIHSITDLPAGWLGKSNALAQGARISSGEYLVFTDADVIMEKTTITRSVQYCLTKQLDHLSLLFKNTTRGCLLNGLILDAGMGLLLLFKPWKVLLDGNRYFIGVGAFNMVRKSVYEYIGGHESIRMHPIDDVMLGKKIKQTGFRQDCLLAQDFVVVPWYDSVKAMVNGLLKNTFSMVHYRVYCVPFQLLAIFVASIFPFVGLFLGDVATQYVCLFTVVVRLITFSYGLRFLKLPFRYFGSVFFTPFISCYIILKSAFVTMYHRGIFWRGRFYPLCELKKSEPLLF